MKRADLIRTIEQEDAFWYAMDDDSLTISAPIYMVGIKIGCWRCGERMPVVAFLAPSVEGADDQVCVLSDVVALPKDLLGYVQKRVPTYQLCYSKTVQGKYDANVCPKYRMLSGDFFLLSEPGAPFFPTCAEEAGLRRFRRAFEGSASQNHSQSLGDELQLHSMCCKCASLHLQSTNLLGRCAKTSIALAYQMSIILK
jgi:hypothetical protein